MGNSSKIRHRRRRRARWSASEIRQIHQRATELADFFEASPSSLEQAVAQAIDDLVRPRDSHVILDPCEPLPGLEKSG